MPYLARQVLAEIGLEIDDKNITIRHLVTESVEDPPPTPGRHDPGCHNRQKCESRMEEIEMRPHFFEFIPIGEKIPE